MGVYALYEGRRKSVVNRILNCFCLLFEKNKRAHFEFTSGYDSVSRGDRPKLLASYLLVIYWRTPSYSKSRAPILATFMMNAAKSTFHEEVSQ
jgi:hypothetical protein